MKSGPNAGPPDRRAGMSLLELVIAMSILAVAIMISMNFIVTTQSAVISNQDRAFGMQKAIAMVNELRAYAETHESTGGVAVLDAFDNGVDTSEFLTTDSTIINPDHILSGNLWLGDRWRYARRITIRKFPSFEVTNARIVAVRVFLTQPGKNDATVLADVSSVVTTLGDTSPSKQVYDVYLLCIENIPGWWVYLAYLQPFIENALSDMESRNPGMEFRRHWITKAAYGRDLEYQPYFNSAVDSNQTINYVYFYPGSMPSGAAVSQYYVPANVRARINIDGTTTNDYNAFTNPYPYTLADQYNHAMRYPDELALYQSRLASGTETTGILTYRLLLDDMILNPQNYRNAIFINVHGELIPMPSIRNYSDAAKDPEDTDHCYWRAVTHPENISYTLTSDVKFRVYAYLSDPSSTSVTSTGTVPISLVISGMDLTTMGDITIAAIAGGTETLYPADGVTNTYTVQSPAPTTAGSTTSDIDRMYATVDCDDPITGTIIRLYNTPLRTPPTGDSCGLATTNHLYGMYYIPCPVEAANDFSANLALATPAALVWEAKANAPSTVAGGGALAYNGGDYIYAFRGSGTQTFSRYSISGNSWTGRANYGVNVNTGGALVYVPTNGRIYGLRGDTQKTFKYYVENSWTARADTPATVGTGGALSYPGTGDFIYAFRGGGQNTFWRYSISGNSWTAMTVAPGAVGAGGALVATGNDYIYAFQGNGFTAFWRYSISGNSWTVMANTGIYNIGAGGALAYDGGDFIYALQGNISTSFLRYSISANTWTVMTAAPGTINMGGALAYANDIYALRGNTQNTFWRGYFPSPPKNTARWVVTISAAAIDRELGTNPQIITVQTRIGDNLTMGERWPTSNHPANLSNTYVWRGYASYDSLPFSERYQFQGDPRHCPYADVKGYHGYNWYFDNLRDSSANVITDWPGFDSTRINGGGDSLDGWHGGGGTSGDMMEIDVPRFFAWIRTALTGANGVYTSVTGWSYYYMGLGNEIGYDSANGFANSISTSAKPFTGGTGSRNEQSITTDQTGGVKYIRENVTPYWWGMPWLGELYPDGVYTAQWTVNGNLNTGSGANTFVRIRRRDMTTSGSPQVKANTLPRGTTFSGLDCVRRTNAYGCTSFFNIDTSTSTFRHQGRDGTTGNIATAGQEMSANYNFPLPTVADISRPFQLAYNWGAVPTEFNISDYSSIRCTAVVLSRFYAHQDGAAWEGSALIRLQNPVPSDAFIVVNGLDRTVESGSAFIGRYSVLSLMHSFLTCGRTDLGLGTSRIVQLPRLEIKEPNVTTELSNPMNIPITWSIEWKRWDQQKYTTAYAGDFAETESDLRYALLYSRDNGQTWLHIINDSIAATRGIPNQGLWRADLNDGGNETYNWDVSDPLHFPEGNYIIVIEAYRNTQPCHYAYHQQKIYINR